MEKYTLPYNTITPIPYHGDTVTVDTTKVSPLVFATQEQDENNTATMDLFATDTHRLITHTADTGTRDVFTSDPLPVTLADNPWIISILILAFAFFAISYHRGAKYLQHTLESLFKINYRGNMFDEITINENQLKTSLLLITFITEGIAIYCMWTDTAHANNYLMLFSVALCIATSFLYYLLQRLVYNILGNTFSDKQKAGMFDKNFITVKQLTGLFLAPIVLLMIFVPDMLQIGGIICFIIYILSRLIIIYKGIRIFSLPTFGLLYLILYLCALEITPLFLIKSGVAEMYKFLELILL